jgi:hypothetical protein
MDLSIVMLQNRAFDIPHFQIPFAIRGKQMVCIKGHFHTGDPTLVHDPKVMALHLILSMPHFDRIVPA